MEIINHIRIVITNLQTLRNLPCVASIQHVGHGLEIRLNEQSTRGCTVVHSGDWIVQFASGLWQRFGAAAHDRLVSNPNK